MGLDKVARFAHVVGLEEERNTIHFEFNVGKLQLNFRDRCVKMLRADEAIGSHRIGNVLEGNGGHSVSCL